MSNKKERKKERKKARKKERKKDTVTSFKRPKWPIRLNKRFHRKCCLVFENKKTKQNKINVTK